MDKANIKKTIEELKNSSKRNFKQTYDLIFVFKNLNMKKPEDQVEFFQLMHFGTGKQIKICGLVGSELLTQAKEVFDTTISDEEFVKFSKDKKALKTLSKKHDFFVAQATIMPKVATSFGRVLGPAGKMPNPKAGCVVPPNANLKPLAARLHKTMKISAKITPMVQVGVGKEDASEEEIIDNIMIIYDGVINHLPSGLNNLKKVMLKLTMSKPLKLE